MYKIFSKLLAILVLVLLSLALIMQTTNALPLQSWDKKIDNANARFIVLKDFNDNAVLDKETQLVWQRDPNENGMKREWASQMAICHLTRTGGRGGWRMPLMEELTSLMIGPYEFLPPLPQGHPFDISGITGDVWSASTLPGTNEAWTQDVINDGFLGSFEKTDKLQVWCVRGSPAHGGQ